jgi:hypothetical protein
MHPRLLVSSKILKLTDPKLLMLGALPGDFSVKKLVCDPGRTIVEIPAPQILETVSDNMVGTCASLAMHANQLLGLRYNRLAAA